MDRKILCCTCNHTQQWRWLDIRETRFQWSVWVFNKDKTLLEIKPEDKNVFNLLENCEIIENIFNAQFNANIISNTVEKIVVVVFKGSQVLSPQFQHYMVCLCSVFTHPENKSYAVFAQTPTHNTQAYKHILVTPQRTKSLQFIPLWNMSFQWRLCMTCPSHNKYSTLLQFSSITSFQTRLCSSVQYQLYTLKCCICISALH